MFFVFHDQTEMTHRALDEIINPGTLRFSDYMEKERRSPENKELFVAGEGTIMLRLLEGLASNAALSARGSVILFDYDVIARIDESVNIKPYFEKILARYTIFYYAREESSIARIKGAELPFEAL